LEVYGISIKKLRGERVEISKYKGKTILIVNVASRCGFTPQYKGLQVLNQKYKNKGLCILAFPCNDFAGQESGSEDEIFEFCDHKYGVTFDIFEKIKIRGSSQHHLYNYLEALLSPVVRPKHLKAKLFQGFTSLMFWLKEGRPPQAGEVQWNFHKFIIGRKGLLAGHFSSDYDPLDPQIIACIEREIEEQ
jgi:glutathione peroxidase